MLLIGRQWLSIPHLRCDVRRKMIGQARFPSAPVADVEGWIFSLIDDHQSLLTHTTHKAVAISGKCIAIGDGFFFGLAF